MDVGSLSCGKYQIKYNYWLDCKQGTGKSLYKYVNYVVYVVNHDRNGLSISISSASQPKHTLNTILHVEASPSENPLNAFLIQALL